MKTNCKRWKSEVEGKVRARNSTGAGSEEEFSEFEKMLERIFCQKTLLSSSLKVHHTLIACNALCSKFTKNVSFTCTNL